MRVCVWRKRKRDERGEREGEAEEGGEEEEGDDGVGKEGGEEGEWRKKKKTVTGTRRNCFRVCFYQY